MVPAFFVLLSLVLTYPLALNLGSRVAGAYKGDNFHYLWQLWYPAHALFDREASILFDPNVFTPFGFDLVKNQDLSPATTLLTIPLTLLIGEVATYNLLILASFALTAFGTYLLARELWKSRGGALFAGIAVGFCQYRMSHAGGHLTIVSTQWIPFFFLYLERSLRSRSLRNGFLCGLFFSLAALTTWYYAFLTLLAAVLYLFARVKWSRGLSQLRTLTPPAFAATCVVVALVGPFAWLNKKAAGRGQMTLRPVEESQAFAASVADFFIPGVAHPILGKFVRNTWRKGPNGLWLSEWELYTGLMVLVLSVLGAVALRRNRQTVALSTLALGSFILALGPSLFWTHPSAVPGAENMAPLSSVKLPVSFLAGIPPFGFLRAWARMGFFVQLALGLLAAGGLAKLLTRCEQISRGRVKWALLSVVLGFAIFETLVLPFGTSSVAPRPVDRWLAAKPGDFAYMEYPITNHAYSGPAMYSRRITGKRIVMGYGSYPPNLQFFETLSRFPAPETLDLLLDWKVRYVVVNEPLFELGDRFWGREQNWRTLRGAIIASPRLKEITVQGGDHVYLLKSDENN